MKYLKNILAFIINFTTGLGFYGIGLLAVAFGLKFIGFNYLAFGLAGPSVYKNWQAIVTHLLKVFKWLKTKVLSWVKK